MAEQGNRETQTQQQDANQNPDAADPMKENKTETKTESKAE